MLAKILEDMWVEPEVLEALSEEQKRILFLKMREEQVRRWTELDEKEEKEGRDNKRPKKAFNKHVKWLLGRDGEVSVRVIGEMDELRSSKLLQSLMNTRVVAEDVSGVQALDDVSQTLITSSIPTQALDDVSQTLITSSIPTQALEDVSGVQALDLLPATEAQQQLHVKEAIQLSVADDDPASTHDRWSEEDSCSADDDLKDPAEDSDSESGGDWAPLYRTHFSSHGNRPPLKAQLSETERADTQDTEIVCSEENNSDSGGRVAQLRKAFTDNSRSTPASNKPPIPAKPAHLQQRSTSLVH